MYVKNNSFCNFLQKMRMTYYSFQSNTTLLLHIKHVRNRRWQVYKFKKHDSVNWLNSSIFSLASRLAWDSNTSPWLAWSTSGNFASSATLETNRRMEQTLKMQCQICSVMLSKSNV